MKQAIMIEKNHTNYIYWERQTQTFDSGLNSVNKTHSIQYYSRNSQNILDILNLH